MSLFVAHGAKCLVLDLLVPSGAIAEGGEEGEGGGGWYDPFTIASPFPPSSTSSFNAALNAPEKSAYAPPCRHHLSHRLAIRPPPKHPPL